MAKKKKSGSTAPFIFIFIIAAIAGSNFVGPAKGWFSKAQEQAKQEKSSQTGQETSVTSPELINTQDKVTAPVEAPAKSNTQDKPKETAKAAPTEMELKHQEFVKEYLAKNPMPELGRNYIITKKDGKTMDGTVDRADEYKLYLSKVKPYNAKTNIHYSLLSKKDRRLFFPKKAANSYANYKLEQLLKEEMAAKEKALADKEKTLAANSPRKPYGTFDKFDTSVAPSSSYLKYPAAEIEMYLNAQTRKVKFADVEKSHAKKQGAAAVFYLYATKEFIKADQEYRHQVTDGIRRFWALRCMSNGVALDSSSYICVVYNDKIIGGSRFKNAADIWSK